MDRVVERRTEAREAVSPSRGRIPSTPASHVQEGEYPRMEEVREGIRSNGRRVGITWPSPWPEDDKRRVVFKVGEENG